jgi:hypothetical protein
MGMAAVQRLDLCKLNRQERWRRLQERMVMMRSAFRDSETDWKRRQSMQSDISMFL